jgi:hypothetical protein
MSCLLSVVQAGSVSEAAPVAAANTNYQDFINNLQLKASSTDYSWETRAFIDSIKNMANNCSTGKEFMSVFQARLNSVCESPPLSDLHINSLEEILNGKFLSGEKLNDLVDTLTKPDNRVLNELSLLLKVLQETRNSSSIDETHSESVQEGNTGNLIDFSDDSDSEYLDAEQ